MDFAVFAVKLSWSRADYNAITPMERSFILKEIERQTVSESELIKGAVELAIANTHRKKGKAYKKLWKKIVGGREVKPPISKSEINALAKALKEQANMAL